MDYLDKLIQFSQIQGRINIQCRFQGDWQVLHKQEPNLLGIFHIVSQGECYVHVDDKKFYLYRGDTIFLPQGTEHHISSIHHNADSAHKEVYATEQGALILKHHDTPEYDFEMFCGYFCYQNTIAPIFQLPSYWVLSSQDVTVSPLLELLQQESEQSLGNQSTINALCHVLFTYLMRDYIKKNNAEGILVALQYQRLYPAVNAMLMNPEKQWNMETLAELCAMSRANFIRLFKQKTQYLPGRFLTDLRMQKAQQLLNNSAKSILAIALEVGYQSEAHFIKTFKSYYGVSPAKFRLQPQQEPQPE
ncbi:TPA: helix-turn-helix domain-containing protein [Pasteurella multocida]|nr:helix-turn-helix domain-containing protein [Pasteurella multocida]